MARYLSPEWFDELTAAAAASPELTQSLRDVRLTIQQVVTGGPHGDVAYVIRIEHGAMQVTPGTVAGADVTVVQDLGTAVQVFRGELRAPAAFMTGRIRVSGNIAALMANQHALQGVDRVFAGVRDRTDLTGLAG